jgi:molybdopterin-guanine dinucleotide biosynthesis protein A
VESPPAPEDDTLLRDRAPASTRLAGVILCGGRSSRMGVDKATITFEGTTLLMRAVASLDQVCEPVLIASGGISTRVPGRRSVADAVPDSGPLGGLVVALRASPHQLLAVVAVDHPWIDAGLLRMLANRIGDRDVAVCEMGDGVEPLHAVYSTSILQAAETALAGSDRSLQRLIGRANAMRVAEREWREAGFSERFARNLNTPEDIAEATWRDPR